MHYPITGMISERYPFYGVDPFGATLGATVPEPITSKKYWRPFVEGLAAGLATYSVSRAFAVDKKKAAQVAFVLGGLSIAIGLASDWLFREVQAVQAAGPATAVVPGAVPTAVLPTAPPTSPTALPPVL